jgi:hypothetical protein
LAVSITGISKRIEIIKGAITETLLEDGGVDNAIYRVGGLD